MIPVLNHSSTTPDPPAVRLREVKAACVLSLVGLPRLSLRAVTTNPRNSREKTTYPQVAFPCSCPVERLVESQGRVRFRMGKFKFRDIPVPGALLQKRPVVINKVVVCTRLQSVSSNNSVKSKARDQEMQVRELTGENHADDQGCPHVASAVASSTSRPLKYWLNSSRSSSRE